ncbi:MAG: hypothetical protein CMH28_09380 [Micavibrio sp.]|nr:hypothetical protein [Micavibrio sp.]
MKFRIALLTVFFTLTTGLNASFAQENLVEGFWLTQNERSVVETFKCNEGLCGKIHWIIEGGMTSDSENPDVSLRNRPLCNLGILWGFSQNPNNPNVWEGGKIYKADDGDTYSATLSVKDANTLFVRGYVGLPIFGKSQTWTRVSPANYPACGV